MDILVDSPQNSLLVAALKDKTLHSLEIDSLEEEVRFGSLYRAKVIDINKSMDAAILDLDGDNIGLLNNADTYQIQDGIYQKGGKTAIGKTLSPGNYVTVQAKGGTLFRADHDDLSLEDKAVRVSMNITLQGRYLIFSPMMDGKRVSKRITDQDQRQRMNDMLDDVDTINGCILRAASENVQTDILRREASILKEIWSRLQPFIDAPDHGLIMEGPDAIARVLSNNAAETIERIDITDKDHFLEAQEWCEIYAPDLVTKVTHIQDLPAKTPLPLFDFHDVTPQIEALLTPYTLLNGGGNIIIQQTAALCAIDVNRGSDSASNLDINLKAIAETCRQLRLMNMGGIILLDLLKMPKKADQERTIKAAKERGLLDPCTLQIHGLTRLGLLEITRERRTPALIDAIRPMITET